MTTQSIIFIIVFVAASLFFYLQVKKIFFNINLGLPIERSDNKILRLKTMARVALGQSKMVVHPVAGIMHIFVYVGFIIINIEMLEIIIDGLSGSHRIFSGFLGTGYAMFINAFEVLAVMVMFGCAIFLIRRNILRLKRFFNKEMDGWPRSDANIILITEILLMSAFLTMNAADHVTNGGYIFSQYIYNFLPENLDTLHTIERICWWFHIVGVLAFLNYLPFSKHFHIILAFFNTYYSNLKPKGALDNMESVKKEVALMFDPSVDPYATPSPDAANETPKRFGAKDVTDLPWKSLMDAYTCTECGRCTSVCPANITGKKLSPRKIMMDIRDRLEIVGKNVRKKGQDFDDGRSLLHDYISAEEIWACTSCNACTEACPVNNEPLMPIIEMRRFLVMEEASSPAELNTMFTNIENNGAPWQMAQADRLKWTEGIEK